MSLLVIGKDGQLATSLAQRDPALLSVGRPEVDLAVPGALAHAIHAARPAVIINAAAYTAVDQAEDQPELAHRINAEAAGEGAAAAAEIGARFIQVSTDYVFDGKSSTPYREDAATAPLGAYGRSKLAGEELVRAANPDHLIVRTAWVYSPFGRNFVKTMMAAAATRDTLRVVDDQRGSPTSALDLADALLTVVVRWRRDSGVGLGQVYHVAGSGETSWCGLAAHVMARCRRLELPAAAIEPIATADWPTRAERPGNSVLDGRKFAADFGVRLPDWRQSVDRTVDLLAKRA